MVLVNAWKQVVLERYAKFDGRAGRAEFWWYYLANIIAVFVLGALAQAVDVFWILYIVYAVAVIVPTLAVAIRRLHDTDKSGWFVLLAIIPLIGTIILIVFYATDGTKGPNRHGAATEPGPATA
jgi:uncharacterized membrane protein YhaH (DUF805 family)